MNSVLYLATVLIWGTTWIAIYFQLDEAPVTVSIFYRFALAGGLLWLLLKLFGRLKRTSKRDQLFMLLQGCCLFSLNFICFYLATGYIASGLVSVVFSLATLYNAVNARWIFSETISAKVAWAGSVGLLGLALLFWPELQATQWSVDTIKGLGLAALGTYLFSLGNMIARRHGDQGVDLVTANAYGMLYGAAIMLMILISLGHGLVWPDEPVYWLSLGYLSVVGSIIGFSAYLLLVVRIGAGSAAYATVMFPVVALSISYFVEGYQWSAISVVGLVFTLVGNLILFSPALTPGNLMKLLGNRRQSF